MIDYQIKELPLNFKFNFHNISGKKTETNEFFSFNMLGAETFFYDNIDTLITDIKNNTFSENGSIIKTKNSTFSYSTNNEIKLETDINLSNSIEINNNFNNLTINLNKHNLYSSNCTLFTISDVSNFTIIGDDSLISIDSTQSLPLMTISNSSCVLSGGYFSSTILGGTTLNPQTLIFVDDSSELNIVNVSADITERNGTKPVSVVQNTNNSKVTVDNSVVTASSTESYAFTILNQSDSSLSANNTSIIANSNYTGSEMGGIGIKNDGVVTTLSNCSVYGTHSGVQSRGELYIDGGEYCSFGHGGLYATSHDSNGNTIKIKNALFYCSPVLNGYSSVTAGTNYSALYIGGEKNISVYMDNCQVSSDIQPIVLKDSSSEGGNNLYISNCQMNNTLNNISNYKTSGGIYGSGIRLRHELKSTNHIYFGENCEYNAEISSTSDILNKDSNGDFMPIRPNYIRLCASSDLLSNYISYYSETGETYDF